MHTTVRLHTRSARPYLPPGAFSWGSAPPESTAGTSGGAAGFGADSVAGSGGLGASGPRWRWGAAEPLAPTPGLTFGFTLRRALRNMAEPGGRERRLHSRAQPRAPAAALVLPHSHSHQPSAGYRNFAAPPPPPLSGHRLLFMTLPH